jgi:EipB-like
MHKLRVVCLLAVAYGLLVAPAVAQIASHRAAYKLSLGNGKSSGIAELDGAMYIDWHEACEGWTISQRMRFQIFDDDGQPIDNDISFSSWEAKDGQTYRFTLRTMRNGEVAEELRGRAELEGRGKGGKAVFSEPEDEVIELPPGTIFPTEHSIELIQKARAGEKIFSRHVFDGATLDGALEINALITGRSPAEKSLPAKVAADLAKGESWRVRMAFFKLEEQAAEPEYETSMRLLDNGVGLDFLFDYKDFSIKAQLEQLEALPKPRC